MSTKIQRRVIPSLNEQNNKVGNQQKEVIQIRELDKRYTHANPRRGKCTMSSCPNNATHWLTRNNAHYCQSDMVCNHHAILWMQVKELVN